jgi:hypothetical protein
MTLIDDIKRDREAGTPDLAAAYCDWGLYSANQVFADCARQARVPDMEAALIAADELARAIDKEELTAMKWAVSISDEVQKALAAYRKATGALK